MAINPQQIINVGTSFVYSWIPALLILWFLIARKTGTKLLPPLAGFMAGAALSILAGYGNGFASAKIFPGYENPAFFFSVGLVEESIKFLGSFLSLFIISRQNWKQDFHRNWLAQAISGSLGFAAAENFVYGIDGQGGIARVIPLIAHTFFAIFWGYGFYKFSLEKKSPKKFLWLLLGLAEGIILHGVYDCVVSETVIPDFAKAIAWIVLGLMIFGIISLHSRIAKKLRHEYYG
ncbi:MAG: PrsW family glutamic-type intramembrane protease, partial [Candidatus Caenarcaniphilales bacterium]|nr:PrsW family glutamic-type intramembrane protease [Candidatus Caenarcaniphilales bacterium]